MFKTQIENIRLLQKYDLIPTPEDTEAELEFLSIVSTERVDIV